MTIESLVFFWKRWYFSSERVVYFWHVDLFSLIFGPRRDEAIDDHGSVAGHVVILVNPDGLESLLQRWQIKIWGKRKEVDGESKERKWQKVSPSLDKKCGPRIKKHNFKSCEVRMYDREKRDSNLRLSEGGLGQVFSRSLANGYSHETDPHGQMWFVQCFINPLTLVQLPLFHVLKCSTGFQACHMGEPYYHHL